jgi:hypothetical protein
MSAWTRTWRQSSTIELRWRSHRVTAVTPNSTADATTAATQATANRCPRPASVAGACTAIAARPAHAPAAARPHVKMTNLSTGPRRSDSIAPSPTIAAAAGPKRTAAITSGMSDPDNSTRVEILTVRDSATYATTARIRTDSHRPTLWATAQ